MNRLPAERYRHAIVCLAGFNPAFRQRIAAPGRRGDLARQAAGQGPRRLLRACGACCAGCGPTIVHTRNLGTVDMQWVAAAAGVRHRVHGEHGWEASDPQGLEPAGACASGAPVAR